LDNAIKNDIFTVGWFPQICFFVILLCPCADGLSLRSVEYSEIGITPLGHSDDSFLEIDAVGPAFNAGRGSSVLPPKNDAENPLVLRNGSTEIAGRQPRIPALAFHGLDLDCVTVCYNERDFLFLGSPRSLGRQNN
jgi:hypothetical protein